MKASENTEPNILVGVNEEVTVIKVVEETAEKMCTKEVNYESCRNTEYLNDEKSLKEMIKSSLLLIVSMQSKTFLKQLRKYSLTRYGESSKPAI